MIGNCKLNILSYKKGPGASKKILSEDILWDHENYPPNELIPVLKSCLDLNAAYQK
jgi:hypothetical protein